MFNIYGKDPEAVRNIIHGFSIALENQDIQDINQAFGVWLKEKSAMPTPADILNISVEERKRREDQARYKNKQMMQIIRVDEQVVEERKFPDDALSALALSQKYKGQNVRVSYGAI